MKLGELKDVKNSLNKAIDKSPEQFGIFIKMLKKIINDEEPDSYADHEEMATRNQVNLVIKDLNLEQRKFLLRTSRDLYYSRKNKKNENN